MQNSGYLKVFNVIDKWKALFVLLLILIPVILSAQQNKLNPQAQQLLNKSNNTRFFIENKGQWPKQVKFLARLGGMNCWITDSGVVYDYYRIDRNYSPDSLMMLTRFEKEEFERTHTSCKGHVVRMDYSGINLNAEKQGTDKRETYYNYFIGNDSTKWASFVGLYGEVLVKEAYTGIDIRYYFDSGQIRYDYLVKPEADISQINFGFTGADALAVNETGELIIKTSLGEVTHGKLYAYQQFGKEKREVNYRFERKDDGNFGLIASDYEKGLALVIDPLIWSTFIGGNGAESGHTIDVDESGNVYIGGQSNNANYPTTLGAYDRTFNGIGDIIISKLDSNATRLVYSTYLGGIDADQVMKIKLDLTNNLVLIGYTQSNNFPFTKGAFDTINGGNYDAFITKINKHGSVILFSTFLGGSNTENANSLVLDSNNNIYLTGLTQSANFPVTSGAFNTTISGNGDVFVSKISSNGDSLINSTFIGGSSGETGKDIISDDSGFVYITGFTLSNNYPVTNNVYDQSFNGDRDIIISKFNSDLSKLIYSTYYGGNNGDYGWSITLDDSINIYIVGQTGSSNIPVSTSSFDTTINGMTDLINAKFNQTLSNLLFSTYLGGVQQEFPYTICLDKNKNVLVSGWTWSVDFPTTFDAFDSTNTNIVAFISQITNDGSKLEFSTYLGGTITSDYGYMMEVDNQDDIYITGVASSFDFPTTNGVYSPNFSGIADVFVSKLDITRQTRNINFTNIGCSKMDISWNKGDTNKRVAFIKIGNNGQPKPVRNTSYIANTSFGLGSQIGSSGWYCIYNDTGTTVSVTGLIPDSTYRVMVLEYSGSTGNEIYTTKTAYKNPLNQQTNKLPIVSFSINDSTQCLNGNKLIFANNSRDTLGTISNLWWFGDGDTSTQINPVHSYITSDSFLVKLVVTNSVNCKDSLSDTILINPSPKASFSVNDSIQCTKWNQFVFTNNSTISKGSFVSDWQFGDGNFSAVTNPIYKYALTDTFLVKLIVTSDSGCTDSITSENYLLASPVAKFIAYDSSQCLERNNFAFTNKSSSVNSSLSYLWDFGDSITSTLFDPLHSYKYASTFTVTLVVSDTFGCTDTFSKNTWVHVHPKPWSDFSVNDSTQCLSGNQFVFSNNSTIKSGTFTQKWDFADGFDTSSYDASHSYSLADSYMVKLLVISDQACKDSILKQVVVHHDQSTGFGISDTSVCIGEVVNFNNSSSYNYGTLTYNWDFGDGNSAGIQNPQHFYSTDGIYEVKLSTNSNFGCKDSVSHKVYVNPMPKTDFTINDTSQCLQGNSFTFTDNSSIKTGSIAQLNFDAGDGNSSSLSPFIHNYGSSGIFSVKLAVKSDQGCSDSLTKMVYIRPMPTAGFSINLNPQNLIGNNFIFTSTSTIPSGNLSFYWYFGDGDTSTKISPNHSYTKTGRYAVKMIVTSDFGCVDTFTDTAVILYPNIKISFSYQKACVGLPVLFKNTSTVSPPDSFLNFLWDFGDGNQTIILEDPDHIYDSPGIYTITLVGITAFGNKDTLTDTIEVFPSPSIYITAVPDTILIPGSSVTLNANGIYDQLLWNDNSTGPSITVQTAGKYWVTAGFTTGCTASDTIWVTDGEKTELEIMNVFTPNGDGYNDYFVIRDVQNYRPVKLSIFNRWGDELYSSQDYQNNWDGTYKGKKLPEGTYYYYLETKDKKLVKGAVNIISN